MNRSILFATSSLVMALSLSSGSAQVDLIVPAVRFTPAEIGLHTYPDQVFFTLGNYGPAPTCAAQLDFILSSNNILGDADDIAWGSIFRSVCLEAWQGIQGQLSTSEREALTLPANLAGSYHVFLRAQPLDGPETDPSDNFVQATNQLFVPPSAPMFAVFANHEMVTSNLTVTPTGGFGYNTFYGNSWRITQVGGGFSATLLAPTEGDYQLRVRHATSSSAGCPNNGYAPVTITVNGTNLVNNYDVAAAHNSYWFENDSWTILLAAGENTLSWSGGDLCTHYWLQRIEVVPFEVPPRITFFHRAFDGRVVLELSAPAGRTNVIEFSPDLHTWQAITNIPALVGSGRWTNSASPPERGFYRAVSLRP